MGPPRVIIVVILLIEQAAIWSTSQRDQSQAECIRQLPDLILGRASQSEHIGKSRQFVIVQLQQVYQLKRLLNHVPRIELLAKIDVEDAQRVWRGCCDQVLNRVALSFATLGQTAKTDRVRAAGNRDGLIGHSY